MSLLASTARSEGAAEAFNSARLEAVLPCRDPDEDGVETPDLSAADWYDDGPREREAASACLACPVVELCGEYALLAREPIGVWGGMTSADRRKALRRAGIRSSRPF